MPDIAVANEGSNTVSVLRRSCSGRLLFIACQIKLPFERDDNGSEADQTFLLSGGTLSLSAIRSILPTRNI